MNIIVPLGGIGKRFIDCGYEMPKPLVKAMGKEIIFWLLDSLDLNDEDQIYIPYNKILDEYDFSRICKSRYPKSEMLSLGITNGAAETISICIEYFSIKGGFVSLDGDAWYEEEVLRKIRYEMNSILFFESISKDPIYSYVQEEKGYVTSIKEKKKISDKACSGCYSFSDSQEFLSSASFLLETKSSEVYVSDVISLMLTKGSRFKALESGRFHVLGTPSQVANFESSFKEE